jgi:isoquinoline 1-oxidoreductase beta subunit
MTKPHNAPAIVNVSRRAFTLGLGAGAFVLATSLRAFAEEAGSVAPEEAPKYGGAGMPHGLVDDPKVFVSIEPDGTVSVVCHRAEMGQGVRTSLPMVVADELEADWARVKVVQAPGDEARYGNQNTDGSRSMRHHFPTMRRVGAAMRQMLEEAAAEGWGVPVEEVTSANHEVAHEPSGRKIGYGDLATAASGRAVPARETLRLKEPGEFRYIGKGKLGLVDNFDMTTGRAIYGIDTRLDGMVYAVVARPPVYGGTVAKYDASEAEKVPGVLKIVEIAPTPPPSAFEPLGGIAVVATNTWAAMQGRDKLKITWNDGPNASYTTSSYRAAMQETARKPGKVVRAEGDVDAAMKRAAKRVTADYYIPHIAHVSMEPPAAVARIVDGRCEAWAATQNPQAARDGIAKRLDLKPENVTVNVTLLGGGFGRKSKPDYVTEAALVSQAMDGRPVKLTWTRDDDIMHDYLNTTAVEYLEAGLDESGKPIAWLHRTVAPSIAATFAPDKTYESALELGMGVVDTPFAIPNIRLENGEAVSHTRVGWFRSVFNVPHAFAIQSFISELAAEAGRDPKDFLLEMIGPPRRITIEPPPLRTEEPWWNYGEDPEVYAIDTGRLARVTETVAKAAGWGRELPKGHGLGIAAHRSFVSYTAAVIEVAVDDSGTITIPRADIAIDCGPQINPERIRSQMEGSVVQGVAIATVSNITFRNGQVEQRNFDGYELTRIDASPREIRVHLVEPEGYDQPLGGVGEPGLPPIAPALTNAVFAATGRRVRALPIADQLGS